MEVLRTDFEFGGTVFSHCFCLWKYSEQILSFKELFFLMLFVCGRTQNRFSVSTNCFFSFFLLVEVLGTDIELVELFFLISFYSCKYLELILSFKELFFLILFVSGISRNRY